MVLLILISLMALVPSVHAWGVAGHVAVARIGQRWVTANSPLAAQYLHNLLLLEEGFMDEVADWADIVKLRRPWKKPQHYLNVHYGSVYNSTSTCGVQGSTCLYTAIANYTGRVNNDSLTLLQRSEALRSLVHYIGEMHQPLHVGPGYVEDLGGTQTWGRTRIRSRSGGRGAWIDFHDLWDTDVILSAIHQVEMNSNTTDKEEDESDEIDAWVARFAPLEAGTGDFTPLSVMTNVSAWLQQSSMLCATLYNGTNGGPHTPGNGNKTNVLFTVAYQYYETARSIIQSQLSLAGTRLGMVIATLAAQAQTDNVFPISGQECAEAISLPASAVPDQSSTSDYGYDEYSIGLSSSAEYWYEDSSSVMYDNYYEESVSADSSSSTGGSASTGDSSSSTAESFSTSTDSSSSSADAYNCNCTVIVADNFNENNAETSAWNWTRIAILSLLGFTVLAFTGRIAIKSLCKSWSSQSITPLTRFVEMTESQVA